MDVSTVIGLGARWIPRVRAWLAERSEEKKAVLSEVNKVLGQDPESLADLYIEPDLQAFNPANLEDDEQDEEDKLFRIPAYKWLDSFLVKPRRRDGRHVAFILSDAGMGKSSILAMLRMSGALEKAWPGIRFRLFKLGDSILEEVKSIKHPFETVLLLDSLDEDVKAFGRIEDRLIELLKATAQFRQVIITSRTQFFPIQNEYERHGARIKLGGFTCKMIFLALFSEVQVDAYLNKLYPQNRRRFDLAKELILSMKSLRMRPMLLAHIEDLLEISRRNNLREWTPFRTHGALVDAWLDREERKPRSKIGAEELRAACHAMAIHLQEVKGLLRSGGGGRTISPGNLRSLLHRENISHAIDAVEEFGGRSLLNLNSEGDYRFAHYSIQEFLVVDHMARHPELMAKYSANIRYSEELVAFMVSWTQEATDGWSADLCGANLSGTDFGKANLRGGNLSKANLEGANFGEASLRGANLSLAKVSQTNFRGADLADANLSGVDFGRAFFEEAALHGVDFSGADLHRAELASMDLHGAIFKNSKLSLADLRRADLSGADFQGADLTRAKLNGAKLYKVNLSDAELRGVNLSGVDLRGMDLGRVRGLSTVQLADASHADEYTMIPEGVERPENWPESVTPNKPSQADAKALAQKRKRIRSREGFTEDARLRK